MGTKQYWSMTEGVFNCLLDDKRTIAFKSAIEKTVHSGDTVVDMGTGSGILAMFAANAGAKKVYAIEWDSRNSKTLEKTFSENGFQNEIVIINGDVRKVLLPEKVDVIIGEMVATGLIEELQIPAMNNLLRSGKPNVKVVLNRIENYIDLVYNNDSFYGFAMKILRYEYPEEDRLISTPRSEKKMYCNMDFSKINNNIKIDEKAKLAITKDGMINGLRISSKTIFNGGSSLDGSPAYCYPIILPLSDTKVRAGDVFSVKLKYKMCNGFGGLSYNVEKIL